MTTGWKREHFYCKLVAAIEQSSMNPMTIVKGFLLAVLFGAASAPLADASEKFMVASFSTVLTEIAQQVGANHVNVAGLVKPGQDPHEYQPTPSDLKQAADAKLILLSGKHLEHYLDKIQQATGAKAESLAVGDALPSLKMKADPDESQAGATAEQNGMIDDPHWWNSVANVRKGHDDRSRRAGQVRSGGPGRLREECESLFSKT